MSQMCHTCAQATVSRQSHAVWPSVSSLFAPLNHAARCVPVALALASLSPGSKAATGSQFYECTSLHNCFSCIISSIGNSMKQTAVLGLQ